MKVNGHMQSEDIQHVLKAEFGANELAGYELQGNGIKIGACRQIFRKISQPGA